MSDMDRAASWGRLIFAILLRHAKMVGRSFSEVTAEYPILREPVPTDLKGMIRYFESADRFFGDLATFYSGPPVFESEGNQRKLLVLRYFSKRECATSLDVSSDLNLAKTNASERLRRYYKQGLLTRRALDGRRRGRRTMVYRLTEAGRRRLAFLEKTVKFKRTETERSRRYRLYQLSMKGKVMGLRQRLVSP